MNLSRKFKFLGIAVALVVVFLAVFALITLTLPTPAPSKKTLDFLRVLQALSDIQTRAETHMSKAVGAPPDLSEVERQQVVRQSDGLVRQVNLRPDGAIAAIIAPTPRGDGMQSAPVKLLLVPEKVGEKYEWRCFGEPVSALPKFCEQLQ